MDMSVTPSLVSSFGEASASGEPGLEPLRWNNRFARLDQGFFTMLSPTALPAPYWVGTNPALAQELGLGAAWL